MPVDQELVDAAVALARERFPEEPWSGAAAVRVSTGEILTSVGTVGTLNPGATLCHETGAILEAHKRRLEVTASVCVARSDRGHDRFVILTPCGICQERLMAWGPEVEVAVPAPGDPTAWTSLRLGEVQPKWWGAILDADGNERPPG
jgi:cytidine deaminase